jgi:Flp pilus assembly protein TadG
MARFRHRRERGAEAVEFALIMVILFPLLFGIIQYGLFFNDFLQARQAVRQGARTGAVMNFQTCTGATLNADQIRCYTKAQTNPASGPASVRVVVPSGWTVGQPLLVCEAVKVANIVGILPMPNNGYAVAKTQMSIEQATTAPTGTFPSTDADPTGQNWSWCT